MMSSRTPTRSVPCPELDCWLAPQPARHKSIASASATTTIAGLLPFLTNTPPWNWLVLPFVSYVCTSLSMMAYDVQGCKIQPKYEDGGTPLARMPTGRRKTAASTLPIRYDRVRSRRHHMGKDAVLHVRIDSAEKAAAEEIYDNIGTSLSEATRIFIKQSIQGERLPVPPCERPRQRRHARPRRPAHVRAPRDARVRARGVDSLAVRQVRDVQPLAGRPHAHSHRRDRHPALPAGRRQKRLQGSLRRHRHGAGVHLPRDHGARCRDPARRVPRAALADWVRDALGCSTTSTCRKRTWFATHAACSARACSTTWTACSSRAMRCAASPS